MPSKRKSPLVVKIFACLMLFGSFAAMIWPCWLKLSADVGPDQIRMNPGELIQSFTGYDAEALKNEARVGLRDSGVQMNAVVLDDLLDRMLDGHFTLPGLAAVCRDGKELVGNLGELRQYIPLQTDAALNTAFWACWGAFGLLALFGLIALVCALTDHRWGILLYFLLGASAVAALLLLRRELNAVLRDEVRYYSSMLGFEGLAAYLGVEVEMVKMGIGAYLCPFLALQALLLMCIRKKRPGTRPSPYPARRPAAPDSRPETSAPRYRAAQSSPPVWFCPNCGFRNGPNLVRCQSCGLDRPGLPVRSFCSSCGESLPPEATFCFSCGAPVSPAPPFSGAPLTPLSYFPGTQPSREPSSSEYDPSSPLQRSPSFDPARRAPDPEER